LRAHLRPPGASARPCEPELVQFDAAMLRVARQLVDRAPNVFATASLDVAVVIDAGDRLACRCRWLLAGMERHGPSWIRSRCVGG